MELIKTNRLNKTSKTWTIAIDDGYCAYKFHVKKTKHSSSYSIDVLGTQIKKIMLGK